jgi:hypothetical protein
MDMPSAVKANPKVTPAAGTNTSPRAIKAAKMALGGGRTTEGI